MNGAKKFFQLTFSERLFLLKCYLLVWTVRLSLWVLPFSLTQKFLKKLTSKNIEKLNPPSERENKIIWAVKASSRFVPGATCLTQALVSRLLLLREGFDVRLRLGVMRDENGEFKAHAWVEGHGEILIGDNNQLSQYTPLPATSNNFF